MIAIIDYGAVSYTHLDVYKRQAVGWTIGAVISVANLIWGLDQTRTWIKNNKKRCV